MGSTSNTVKLTEDNIEIATSAFAFKQMLLSEIASANTRIFISALYVQDDAAGKEILTALYQAKSAKPQLDICIFVDYHRAQRGLIGEKHSLGNRQYYLALEQQYDVSINIYGIPVKRKELMGVLHLKGMIFDDILLYSGASINDVYLQQNERYRLDRYYRINNKTLADSFCQFYRYCFIGSKLAPRINQALLPEPRQLKRNISRLGKTLKNSQFLWKQDQNEGEIAASLYVGFGRRGNKLNQKIREVVQHSQYSLVIFTPYFNFPKPLLKDVDAALRRGVRVDITVGDKTANDFYNPDESTFSTVSIVPYVYERLLATFLARRKKYLARNQLVVRLWKHNDNSFHLKGIVADNRYHFLTGSNLNPRAWALDVENGILLDDEQGKLKVKFQQERDIINENTRRLTHVDQLERINQYPDKPRKLLRKIKMTQVDRLLKRLL